MAKQYPRFLFSNPKNVKSRGAYVIHTSEPHIILGVYDFIIDRTKYKWLTTITPKPQFSYDIAILSKHVATTVDEGKKYKETLDRMIEWLHFQIKDGHISI